MVINRQKYLQSFSYSGRYSNNERRHQYSFLHSSKLPAPFIYARGRYYIHNPMAVTVDSLINQPAPLPPTAGVDMAATAKMSRFAAVAKFGSPSNNEQPPKVKANANQPLLTQGIRQALPQQQPLRNLLPLIQQIAQQSPQQASNQLLKNLNTLLQQFLTSQQAAQPKSLQQALINNGIFFEAKIAQQRLKTNAGNSTTRSSTAINSLINQDLKGLLQLIARQLAKSGMKSNTNVTGQHPLTSPLSAENSTAASQTNAEHSIDILLRQLSRQLLASLARTQLNQLETLAARSANTADNQGPINSWTLELPIIHGKNIDSLELRIDQYLIDDEEPDDITKGKKQWTVMLAFDLHALGKINIQLNIIEKSVSATVWSQLENTHREVKQQANHLSNNLKKIGVNVEQLDCQLGLPPKSHLLIYQQLVDVTT